MGRDCYPVVLAKVSHQTSLECFAAERIVLHTTESLKVRDSSKDNNITVVQKLYS